MWIIGLVAFGVGAVLILVLLDVICLVTCNTGIINRLLRQRKKHRKYRKGKLNFVYYYESSGVVGFAQFKLSVISIAPRSGTENSAIFAQFLKQLRDG